MKASRVEVVVLGIAQDGGIPQIGCGCAHCRATARDATKRQAVSSLGIIDFAANRVWLLDASPDIRDQLALLRSCAPGCELTGILLTHAHIGHYLGLAYLGREAWNCRQLPVLCTQRLADFVRSNQPWRQLVDAKNITLSILTPGDSRQLSPAVTVTPLQVPHRDELSDTVAYLIAGPNKQLLYCPDIDGWKGPILSAIAACDTALLDGTFYSPDELPGRNVAEIPHPCVCDSLEVFAGYDTVIHFIHLNHSNRLLNDAALVEGLERQGFAIARQGERFVL